MASVAEVRGVREDPLLEVRDLTVAFEGHAAPVVDQASFDIDDGEAVGLLGESGCGKTTMAQCLLGMPPPGARVLAGSVRLEGRDLLALGEDELQRLRGDRVATIFQEPALALNPVLRVGRQIEEVLRAHRDWDAPRRRAEVASLIARVRLDDVPGVADAYPHQLSGGQRQRVLIAQALACRPPLLVADEPTAALDTALARQILELLRELQQSLGLAVLLISHDPRVLAAATSRLLVMYAGRLVEAGPTAAVCERPLHPYTRGLLDCLPRPRLGRAARPTLAGSSPGPRDRFPGCPFEPRCGERQEACTRGFPPEARRPGGRRVHCRSHEA